MPVQIQAHRTPADLVGRMKRQGGRECRAIVSRPQSSVLRPVDANDEVLLKLVIRLRTSPRSLSSGLNIEQIARSIAIKT